MARKLSTERGEEQGRPAASREAFRGVTSDPLAHVDRANPFTLW